MQAAEQIRARLDIPIVYLTPMRSRDAGAGQADPDRSLYSQPIEERDLQATIEMALYKHDMDKRSARANAGWPQRSIAWRRRDRHRCQRARQVHELCGRKTDGWAQAEALGKELTAYSRD